MSAENVQKLSAQIALILRAIARPFDIVPATSDELVHRLAAFLDSVGTTSTLDLTHFDDPVSNQSFFYDMRTGYVFKDASIGNVVNPRDGSHYYGLNALYVTQIDRFQYAFVLTFTADGYPVFVTIAKDQGSDWVDYRGGIIFVASVVISAGFSSLGASIGQAMFAGTSVPASVATAVGNVAVSTVLNGGDVQGAVVGAVSGGVGGAAGSIAASATDAQWIGSAAAAATSAAIRGGDLTQAVGMSLLTSGAKNMEDFLFPSTDVSDFSNMDFDGSLLGTGDTTGYTFGGDVTTGYNSPGYYTDSNGVQYGYDASGDLVVIDQVDANGIGYYTDPQGDVMVADSSQPTQEVVTNPANLPAPSGSGASSNTNYGALIAAGLSLVKAYQAAQNPAVRTYTQSTQARANGTVAQVVAGHVVTTKPPVGVPFQMANGGIITNNGDGTFTTISPTGQTTTTAYAGNLGVGSSSINSTTLLIAAAGLGALLLLRGRA